MNTYIPVLPGEVKTANNVYTNILALLGMNDIEPIAVENDGRYNPPVATLRIGNKQYELSKVLERLASQMSGGLWVEITKPNASYKTSKTFAEMAAADNLTITWQGRSAVDMAYTKSSGKITAITARFFTLDMTENTLTVSTFAINSSGITKTDSVYDLEAHTEAET